MSVPPPGADPVAALRDPRLDPSVLAGIAQSRPDLHGAVAAHPNADAGLLHWLVQYGDPAARAIAGQRLAASPAPTPVPPPPVHARRAAGDGAYAPPPAPAVAIGTYPPATPNWAPAPYAYSPPAAGRRPNGWVVPVVLIVALAVIVAVVLVALKPWATPSPVATPTLARTPTPTPVPSPVAPWAKAIGGTQDDVFVAVAVTPDGSVVAVGDTESTGGDFPTSHGGTIDALIARFAPDGTLAWAKTLGGSGSDYFSAVAVAPDGSITATGDTSSADGDFPRTHIGAPDAVVARFTPDGTMLWAHTFGGRGGEAFPAVAIAPDGGVIVAGNSDSTDGDLPNAHGAASADAVVAKLTPDGQISWATALGGNKDDGFFSVVPAPDGSIVVAGVTASTDGDFPSAHGSRGEAVVAKLDANGTLLWANAQGGSDDDEFYRATLAPDGDIIAVGYTASTDGSFPTRHGDSVDALIVRYSPEGMNRWAHVFGGSGDDYFMGAQVAPDGSLYVVGENGSTDGDFPAVDGDINALVTKLDADGAIQWARTFAGADTGSFWSMALTAGGNIVAAGITSSFTGDFPPSHGGLDALVVTLTPSGLLH